MTRKKKNLIWIGVGVSLILLPWIIYSAHSRITAVPRRIVIGSGTIGGQYRDIAETLKDEIEARHPGVAVTLVLTDGSLENRLLLEAGKLDFTFYHPGILETFERYDPASLTTAKKNAAKRPLRPLGASGKPAFVANLYTQPSHLIIHQGIGIHTDNLQTMLRDKKVAVGPKQSGTRGMSMVLLKHFGLKLGDLQIMYADSPTTEFYDKVEKGIAKGELDAAFITMGVRAPIFRILAETGKCKIINIPNRAALLRDNLYLSQYEIPAGLYSDPPHTLPRTNVETVASAAQLLTRKNANPYMVQAVTRIVLDTNFARKNGLNELFNGGREFAKAKPEFAIHQGAQSVYEPELDIHWVESYEAAYSLAVSVIIAAFLGFRWFQLRRARKAEHKLDRYIRSLLDIEQRQVPLDGLGDSDQFEELQKLLDEVTALRQEALCEFTAHELHEDRGTDCFINMCHALSNKINAKLSRQQLDIAMQKLVEAIKGGTPAAVDAQNSTMPKRLD